MKAMEERYKMYLEKARNVSKLSYRAPVFVMQVLSTPVPRDCTAVLISASCPFAAHYPALQVRLLVCLHTTPCVLSLTHPCQIKQTRG